MIAQIITFIISIDVLLFCCGAPSFTGWLSDKF
jgi:hypothetical protein